MYIYIFYIFIYIYIYIYIVMFSERMCVLSVSVCRALLVCSFFEILVWPMMGWWICSGKMSLVTSDYFIFKTVRFAG